MFIKNQQDKLSLKKVLYLKVEFKFYKFTGFASVETKYLFLFF